MSPVAGLAVTGCAAYCIWLWRKPVVPTLAQPDIALTCWLYCGTYHPFWGAVALLSGGLLVVSGVLMARGHPTGPRLAMLAGVITLPVGLLAIGHKP